MLLCANWVWINVLKLHRGKVLVLALSLVIILPACTGTRAKIFRLKVALQKLWKGRIMCTAVFFGPVYFHHCAAIVNFLQVLSFYKTKNGCHGMCPECWHLGNVPMWNGPFPCFVSPVEGDVLALLHRPPLAFERVFTGGHSLLLQIFYLLLLTTSSLF